MTTARRHKAKKRTSEQITQDVASKARGGSPCPWPPDDPGYIAWHADAAERMAVGQDQKMCDRCKLYRWKDEQKACDDKIKRSSP